MCIVTLSLCLGSPDPKVLLLYSCDEDAAATVKKRVVFFFFGWSVIHQLSVTTVDMWNPDNGRHASKIKP